MEFFIHHFVFILPQYTTNQFDGQLKVDLLSQLVRELHRYRRARGLNPDKPEFFQVSGFFCPMFKLRLYCDDHLYISFYCYL